MPTFDGDEEGITVNAGYVYRQLLLHAQECSRRWWAVMLGTIANLLILVAGMATIIVNLLALHH